MSQALRLVVLARVTEKFDPSLHPHYGAGKKGGQFRPLADRVLDALKDDDTALDGLKREQLRDVAKKLGVPMRRGISETALKHEIKVRSGRRQAPPRGSHDAPTSMSDLAHELDGLSTAEKRTKLKGFGYSPTQIGELLGDGGGVEGLVERGKLEPMPGGRLGEYTLTDAGRAEVGSRLAAHGIRTEFVAPRPAGPERRGLGVDDPRRDSLHDKSIAAVDAELKSRGGPVKAAKKAAPVAARRLVPDRQPHSHQASGIIERANRDLADGMDPGMVAENLRQDADDRLTHGEPLGSDDLKNRGVRDWSDEDLREVARADVGLIGRLADDLERSNPPTKAAPKAPSKAVAKVAAARASKAPVDLDTLVGDVRGASSEDDVERMLAERRLTVAQLRDLAGRLGPPVSSKGTAAQLRKNIAAQTAGLKHRPASVFGTTDGRFDSPQLGAPTPRARKAQGAAQERQAARGGTPTAELASAIRDGGSEGEIVRLLDSHPTMTPTRLRELAADLGIDVPASARTRQSIQSFIAPEASRRFGGGDGRLGERAPKPAAAAAKFDPAAAAERVAGRDGRGRSVAEHARDLEALLADVKTAADLRRVATALNTPIPRDRRTAEEIRRYIAEQVARDRTRWSLR